MTYAFFDIHSHLHDTAFDNDREKVAEEMKAYGLGTITVGTDIKHSKEAVALAEKYEHIYATVGLHPADNVTEVWDKKAFKKLGEHSKVIAVGDYHQLSGFISQVANMASIVVIGNFTISSLKT